LAQTGWSDRSRWPSRGLCTACLRKADALRAEPGKFNALGQKCGR
jgi:hypothetical protein